jgi:hypothetical protein
MVAWDEIWQGYPDHWMKVYGNLQAACELVGNSSLADDLAVEMTKFNKSIKDKKKYRPCFEKMACDAICEEEKMCINPKEILDTQFCFDCALKHLSEASVEYNGKDKLSWIKVVGNMASASNHLIEKYEAIANEIRVERKKYSDSLISGKAYRPDFENLSMKVKEIQLKNIVERIN